MALSFAGLAPAIAQTDTTQPRQWPVARLKQTYLECSDRSLDGRMGRTEVMHCSVVYEALKERAFGGDFERLLAWSRAQAPAPATSDP